MAYRRRIQGKERNQLMEQHEQGEIVWKMSLRELQVNHLDENELHLFYNSLEDAINDVLTNYEVELTFGDE